MISKNFDCIVIGGGYAGCVLALACANFGINVCIIEKNDILARKILSTGNGRCNFTNSDMSALKFYSSSSEFNFSKIDYKDSISFMRSIGVVEKDLNGYYYPITNQAKTIREAIEYSVNRSKISCIFNTQVKSVEKGSLFQVKTTNGTYTATYVVVATGGLAAPKLGSTGDGLYIAKQLNIDVVKTAPGLVGLLSSDKKLKKLAGLRCPGNVIYKDHSCEGEIQFTKDSISGYPVMCLSRFVALNDNPKDEIYIDFAPFFDENTLRSHLEERLNNDSNISIFEILSGFLSEKIIEALFPELIKNSTEKTLNKKEIDDIVFKLKNSNFSVSGTKGYENAQTTAGGVKLEELTENFMAKKYQGLYFVGEVVDVDGICGGYNLEWARYSATKAAEDIINDSNRSN